MPKAKPDSRDGSVSALLELAAELQRTQYRLSDAEIREMGQRLGLDARTVRSAVDLRFGSDGSSGRLARVPKLLMAPVRSLSAPTSWLLAAYRKRPYLTTVGLTACFVPLLVLLLTLGAAGGLRVPAFVVFWINVAVYAALLCSLAYVGAGMRRAIGMSVALTLCWWAVMIVGFIVGGTFANQAAGGIIMMVAVVPLSMFITAAPILMFFGATGRYVTTLRRLREDRDADRQTLLQRVFELNQRLCEGDSNGADVTPPPTMVLLPPSAGFPGRVFGRDSALYRWVEGHTGVSAFLFVAGAVFLGFWTSSHLIAPGARLDTVPAMFGQLIGIVVNVLIIVGLFQLAALAGSIRRAITVEIGATLAMVVLNYLVWLWWPDHFAMRSGGIEPWLAMTINGVLNAIVFVFPIGAGAMAAAYARNVGHEMLLAANDRETIEEELAKLQERLHREVRHVHFLVTDVVGSTRMKAGADMLAVEYSFTEYHRYVAERVLANQGAIHSTAGDGVIATFPNADCALQAGLAIQRELDDFNETRNTLPSSFHLRVGIHAGPVAGAGHTVAYSYALDVTSHVERVCPPGKLAVTQEVLAATSTELAVDEHTELVDGNRVLIVTP